MNKTNIKLVKATLKHWDKMIKWASEQKPRKWTNEIDMGNAIAEGWHGSHCPLCEGYETKNSTCVGCPLDSSFGKCGTNYGSNLWIEVAPSRTWGTFVKNAKLFRKQIASLLK